MSIDAGGVALLQSGGASFVLGLALTPLVILFAGRAGMVARPRADRWSRRPTALLGGTAIFGAFAGGLAVSGGLWPDMAFALAAGALIFGVGLVDDLRSLRPQHKLLAQVAAACILVAGGVHFGVNGGSAAAWLFTILFVVGITNAINLLDNMDGLAAGVSAAAALVIAAGAAFAGNQPAAVAASALAGASLSFLVFNFHPARVFMGDCGSMFLGLMLAALAIETSVATSTAAAWAVLFPCVVLAVPIFDTTFVTVMRKMNGRAISQGGCDHTSHRLVRLGLSEPQAVLLLCGVSLLIGVMGVAAMLLRAPMLPAVGSIAAAGLLMLGRVLARVDVYSAVPPSAQPGGTVLFAQRLHKKQTATALADMLLAFSASVLTMEMAAAAGGASSSRWEVALLVGGSAAGLALAGVYRGAWRHLDARAFLQLAAGCVAGTVLSLAAGLATGKAPGLPAAGAYAAILLLLLTGSRALYRLLSGLLPGAGRWVLVTPPGMEENGAGALARASGLADAPSGVLTLDVEAPRSLKELERVLSETRPGAVVVASQVLLEPVEEICRRRGVRCLIAEEGRR